MDLPAPLGPTIARRASGRQAQVDAVQRGLLAVRVAGADALEREGERSRLGGGAGTRGVRDAHRAGGEVEDPAAGAQRGGELAGGGRQRLDRLERRRARAGPARRRAPGRAVPAAVACTATARTPASVAPVTAKPRPSATPPASASRRARRTSRRSAARTRASAAASPP